MKRYDILEEDGGCCPLPELKECTWGEWVRHEDYLNSRTRVAELEAALERIILGPYAGDFCSTVEVASEVLKHKP